MDLGSGREMRAIDRGRPVGSATPDPAGGGGGPLADGGAARKGKISPFAPIWMLRRSAGLQPG